MACSWGPSPSIWQVPGSSPGPRRPAARAFSSTLPSFHLRKIIFAPSHHHRKSVRVIVHHSLGLTNPNAQKSYKNYLQNTSHVVLRNRPTLSIATEARGRSRISSRGRAAHALFPPSSHPSSSFFRTFPTTPVKELGLCRPISLGAAGISLGTEIGTSNLVNSFLLHPNLRRSISVGSSDKADFKMYT